jgi:hypothetical protein
MRQVTFNAHIRQVPYGRAGSIVRLSGLDNAKSSPGEVSPQK